MVTRDYSIGRGLLFFFCTNLCTLIWIPVGKINIALDSRVHSHLERTTPCVIQKRAS